MNTYIGNKLGALLRARPFGRSHTAQGGWQHHAVGRLMAIVLALTLSVALLLAMGPATADDGGEPATEQTAETTELTDSPAGGDSRDEVADPPADKEPVEGDDFVGGDNPPLGESSEEPIEEDADEPAPQLLTRMVAPASVPSPGAGEAVIHVKVGSDRTGNAATAVSPRSGVKLGLWNGNSSGPTGSQLSASWATCTSDAQGDCSFVVPETGSGGANRDDRFWVQQVDAGGSGTPANYFASTTLGTAGSSTPYRFRTGSELRSGNTYDSGDDFMGSSSGVTESSGIWQVSRNNPALPAKCGLDVALVLDLSTSIGSDIGNLKAAANGFVDALTGTPSRIATFSFGSASPASGTSNTPALMSVSSSGAAVKATYSGWSIGTNYTNWDQALKAVADAAPHYDAVVVITDGNPTVWGTSPDSSVDTTLREVEYGVFSANLVKSENSRVIAFGVGDGVSASDSGLNLRAISGPTKYNSGAGNAATADYFQVSDFAVAGQALRALALGTCQGSLTVVKQVVPEGNTGENVSGAQTAGGWSMTAAPVAPLTLGSPATQSTDAGTGAVNYQLVFPGGTTAGQVSVTEAQQADHVLVTQNAKNAVCKNVATGGSLSVTNTGSSSNPGFTVAVTNAAPVSCTIYNRPTPQADVKVDKTWLVNGTSYANGAQPAGLTAQLTLTEPGQTAPTNKNWGQVYGGYLRNGTTRINEVVTTPTNGCTVLSRKVTKANGSNVDVDLSGGYYTAALVQDHNTYTITNQVTCPVKLKVLKKDENGNPLPGATFTFTPNPVTGSGTLAVTDNGAGDSDNAPGVVLIDPARPGTYTVEETGAPAGYALPKVRSQEVTATTAGSTGELTFVDRLLWQAPTIDKTVIAKYDATYAWSLLKTVRNGAQGTPGPSAEQQIAAGEEATFGYDITVTHGAQERSNFRAHGTISATNPNAAPMKVTLADTLPGATCSVVAVDVDPGVAGKQVNLAVGANSFDYTCSYAAAPANQDSGTNTATLTWSKADHPQTQADADAANPGTGTATKAKAFDFVEDKATNKTITVTDDKHVFSPAWTVTWSGEGATETKSYTWTTDGTPGTCTSRTNVVEIVETGQTDSADAKVCVGADLTVSKVSAQSLTRGYLWNIAKASTDTGPIMVDPETGTATAHFDLTLSTGGVSDSGWLMSGTITVTNPNDWEDVVLTGLADSYSGGGTCTVDDWDTMTAADKTVLRGASKGFDYTCVFATKPTYAGTNTATATWSAAAAHTPTGTDDYDLSIAIADWDLDQEVNKQVSVWDAVEGLGLDPVKVGAGSYTWSDPFTPVVIPYTAELTAPSGDCQTWRNVGAVRGDGGVEIDSDDATIEVCNPSALELSKTAAGQYDRTYRWALDKAVSADPSSDPETWTGTATWSGDQYSHVFGYLVTLSQLDWVDSAWAITGTITVTNPNTDPAIPAISSAVTDTPDVGAAATCVVDGGPDDGDSLVGYPTGAIASGDHVDIDYRCTFTDEPNYTGGSNVVTGTNASNSPHSVDVGFTKANEIDKSVTVVDDKVALATPEELGSVTYDEAVPNKTYTWDYELAHTATAVECQSFTNHVSVFSDDSQILALVAALTPLDTDEATATVCPNPGTWTVAKGSDVGDGPVPTDSDITYTLTAHKTGGVNPEDVVLTDDLSDLIPYIDAFVPPVAPVGTTVDYDAATHVLTWTIAELGDTDRTLDFTVHLKADAYGVDLPNLVTSPGSTNCPTEEEAGPGCETDNDTPHYTLEKSSDAGASVLPPYLGDPGALITYTLTVHNDSDAPINPTTLPGATVTDDLAEVLDDAVFVAGSLDPAGQAELNGSILTWTLPEIPVDGTVTLTYQVRVDDDQWDETLTNDAAPGDGGDCVEEGACTTTTVTPPYTQIQALKVDFETGEPLAGAEFSLFDGETEIDTAVSDESGIAFFDVKLQPGEFTVQETQAPAGYDLPINGLDTVSVVIDEPDAAESNFVENGVMVPIAFEDPALGQLALLPKAQFERDPLSLLWVPSDGVVEFGDEVRYVVPVASEGEKLFHDVTLTDYVPGWNPADVTTSPAGTKAELVVDSITCGGGITCTTDVDLATGLITWELTETGEEPGVLNGAATGFVEFVVRMPDIPGTSPIQTPGTAFAAALWNQAYLDWDQQDFVADEQQPEVLVPTMRHHELVSNEVVVTASATLPPEVIPPAGPTTATPTPGALPATGGPDLWLLLAGLVLLLGGGTVVAADRRRKHRS